MLTIRLTATVGAILKASFVKNLKDYCWLKNYAIEIIENKHLTYSDYRIAITVPDEKYDIAHEAIKSWLNKIRTY